MRISFRLWQPLFAALLISLPLHSALAAKHTDLNYLSPDSIRIAELLPDPPTDGSYEQQCELDEVRHIHSSRTSTDLARAQGEKDFTVFAFADVVGPGFSADRYPKTAALFAAIESDSKYFEKQAKKHWNRPRPPLDDPTMKPDKEESYPSGHSTRSTAMAEILAQLFPTQKEKIESRRRQIGWDRVILGVHYPSDVLAGRVLGQAIAQKLLASQKFQEKLQEIKEEITEIH